jgi:hypothetical protein
MEEILKSCGNCVFFDYSHHQKMNAKKHHLETLSWGICTKKNNEPFYKKQVCDEHKSK